MTKTLTVPVSARGDVRLPRAYRRRYGAGRGERLRVLDVAGLLVLLPPASRLSDIQRRFSRAARAAGVSMKDLGGPAHED
jgi:hypothetical protein